MSLESVVCCHVEVSATGRFLVQRPTECVCVGVCVCVCTGATVTLTPAMSRKTEFRLRKEEQEA
jgi:hypothetical protein